MNKLHRIAISALCASLLFSTTAITTTYASTNNFSELSGNMAYHDNLLQTRDQTKPTSVWNIANRGKKTFAAQNIYQFIYTNYLFTGKKNYTINVYNSGDTTIEVFVVKQKLIGEANVITPRVQPGRIGSYNISLNTNERFYIFFQNARWNADQSSSMSFSGAVY